MPFEDIKPNDLIIVQGSRVRRVARVTAVAPKQFTAGGQRFWKETGRAVGYTGNGYNPGPEALAYDEGVARAIRREQLQRELAAKANNYNFRKMPLVSLQKVAELIEEAKGDDS